MKRVDFSNGKTAANILATAGPMFVAQVMNLLYNIVDRIYISRIPDVGTAALGGVGICFPVIILIGAFTNLYGTGGAPLFSIEMGKGDMREAGKVMDTAFFLEWSTGLLLMLAGYLFAKPVLTVFGASGAALRYSLPYMRIYLLGTLFSMSATGMNPYINAQGFPGTGMFTVLIGAASNLILDPLFIFGLGMGVRGAALATVLSQMLSAGFALRFLFGKKAPIRLHVLSAQEIRKSGARIINIVSLGISSFVMMLTSSLVQIVCNNMLVRYGGDIYVSIMTIISSVRQMVETPVFALTEGASPVISFNYGARKPEGVRQGILFMAGMAVTYTALVWVLILRFPEAFISVFSSDRTILTDAIPAMHLYFGAFIFMTLQYCGQTTFKALNKKKQAIFFSILRKGIIVVPLTLLLPTAGGLGTDGVFLAEPVSNLLGGTACFVTMLLTVLPELRKMEQKNS